MRKFFLRTAAVLLIVAVFFTSAIVGAAVQTFDGQGDWQTIEEDDQKIAMERALQRAKNDAKEKNMSKSKILCVPSTRR